MESSLKTIIFDKLSLSHAGFAKHEHHATYTNQCPVHICDIWSKGAHAFVLQSFKDSMLYIHARFCLHVAASRHI